MNDRNIIGRHRPLIRSNWLKIRFFKNKLIHKTSRYLIANSINYLLERDQRKLCKQNNDICRSIEQIDQHLDKLIEKLNTLNDICLFRHILPNIYFEERMIRLRHSAKQYMAAIEQEIREEVEHWQNIHSILSQPLLEPGLLRSYYGGLPQQVQQSPASEIDTICEENEFNETIKSSKKSNRSLATINTFSILSNGMNHQYLSTNKLNKTFVKTQSSTNDSLIEDENFTSAKSLNTFAVYRDNSDSESDTIEDSIIYVD